jgi:hypothetical protein
MENSKMIFNPLIFVPSVRDIKQVWDALAELPYDKLVIKMKRQNVAYPEAKEWFLNHEEYTHLVICPDDLVLDYDTFMILARDVKEYEFSNLCGICNLEEGTPDTYTPKALGIDYSDNTASSYWTKETIPDEIFEVGFTGSACQFIERDLVKLLSFTGYCENGQGCFDAQFAKEMTDMKRAILVQPEALFWHMRKEQYKEVREWLKKEPEEGYTALWKV